MENKFYPLSLLFVIFSHGSSAQTFNNLNFDFTEYAFSNGSLSGSNSYNLINDTTGAELTSDNGDLDDLTININTSIPLNASGAVASAEINSSGLRSNHGYSRTFASTYSSTTANNPGTLIKQTIRFSFANHLSIDNFTTDFRSLNTAGITWEHTELAYLQKDGSYFASQPFVGTYNEWQTTNAGNPSAEQGSPAQGWWIAGSTGSTIGVGSDATTSGSNGSDENFTTTNGNNLLDYNDVGLAAGTEIGGFEWTVYLYDNRGQNNNQTNWTVTQEFFEISGTVPEPSSSLLLCIGSILLIARKSRR